MAVSAGLTLLTVSAAPMLQTAVASPAAAASSGSWTLSATDPSANYAPTFIGNGYLAARVPAEGAGYSRTPITTQAELAGFYADPPGETKILEQRASLPTWTTLGLSSGADSFGNLPLCVFDEVCEATVAGQLSGGAVAAGDHGGSTGGSFVAGLGVNQKPVVGATVTVPVTQSAAGPADLAIRYANGNAGSQTVSYSVNGGALQQITLQATGSWDTWRTATVPATLLAGTNTVAVTVAPADSGQVNIDTVAAFPVSGSAPTVLAQSQQGTKSNYNQTLDMRTGTLTTSFTWTAPSGKVTDFTYTVNADQSDGHVGMVTMTTTPHWSGTATITDALDGRGLNFATVAPAAVDGSHATLTETATTQGDGVSAALASVLRIGTGATTTTALTPGYPAQSASLTVTAGSTITATKFIGIASSNDTDRSLNADTPQAYALSEATAAANLGAAGVTARNNTAWSSLWSADILVPGDDALTGQIRASMFYLLESVRAGVSWSTGPGGLSSDGYKGHVFWDMETWMYPALLAGHPDIAASIDAYRQKLLPQAETNTAACAPSGQSISGAKFPWESGLTGKDALVDGKIQCDEIHITADVALAQWQYYQATGDTTWLTNSAWPLLRDAARYFASRAKLDTTGGGYQILNVQGPDEYHDHVNNEAYTNTAAQQTLQIAIHAAQVTGNIADANWTTVADGLTQHIPFDTTNQRHLEFDGYSGQTAKQADVTMLQYPWNLSMSSTVAQNDLDYYGESTHTDLGGPSMTDAIAAIDSAALTSSRCDSYTYLQRSINPFMRAPFNQFQETRGGGAFDFTTGAGGFLQEFEYGFTGLRWNQNTLHLDPNLPPQLPGLNLTGLHWQGRTYNLSISPTDTTITLATGPAMPVTIAGGATQTVASGSSLTVPTREPAGSTDVARCRPATADSADPSYPAAAAVDGNTTTTAWHATKPGAYLTVDLGTITPLDQVQVQSDGATTAYTIQGSNNNAAPWTTLASQSATSATTTSPTLAAASYRYVRYQAAATAIAKIVDFAIFAPSGPIHSAIPGLCVDDQGGTGTTRDPIQAYTCNGTPAQNWTAYPDGTIRALGKCMDVHLGATANGTVIWLYTCNGTGAQQWQPQADGTLKNPQSGRCLTDPGSGGSRTQLQIQDCSTGAANQKWTLP